MVYSLITKFTFILTEQFRFYALSSVTEFVVEMPGALLQNMDNLIKVR